MDTRTAERVFADLANNVVEGLVGYEGFPPPSVEAITEAARVLGTTPREATARALDRWWCANRDIFQIDERRAEVLMMLERVAGRPLALA